MTSAGSRRDARERALSLLYEAEVKGVSAEEVLAELPMRPEPFVVALLQGVGTRGSEIDTLLQRFLKEGWTIDRLGVIDRAVLRIGVNELLAAEVPAAVAISEAVELVKRFSTDDSSRFVNGVLSAVARDQAPR